MIVRWLSAVATDFSELQLVRDNGLASIVLNRPERKNALGKTLVSELSNALDQISRDRSVRVVTISSRVPGVFCAGADLKERAEMAQDEVSDFVSSLRSCFSQISDLPQPTIAAIEGAALGGGLELALACDFRVVGEKAKLGLPETSLAIIPGAGGTQRLTRLVGLSRAKELVFTARKFGAREALEYGIADRLASDGLTAEAVAKKFAEEILPNVSPVSKISISFYLGSFGCTCGQTCNECWRSM